MIKRLRPEIRLRLMLRIINIILVTAFIPVAFSACSYTGSISEGNSSNSINSSNISSNSTSGVVETADFKVVENKNIYMDDLNTVDDIYITVSKNNKSSLGQINNYRFQREKINEEKPYVEVLFSTSKPSTATVSNVKANAVLMPRGHGTGMTIQKSLKIKLFDNAGSWKGQTVLNLNKHPYDLTRVRNKLSFDIFKTLPDMFSFRTQFCHLFVRDLNDPNNSGFVDYGLFTHIEQPNKNYFKSHGILENGYIYKAEYFEFFRYEDIIKNVDDPLYNKTKFEEALSIIGVEDHTRLIHMLEDVNNLEKNINEVIEEHFDRDNYITWLAVNILLGNHDTNSQNFILASPVTSNKWYFIPWDYDQAWSFDTQPGYSNLYSSWEMEGISNYWGVPLHQRFFKVPENMEALRAKIDELTEIITEKRVMDMLNSYRALTEAVVKIVPDIKYLPSTFDMYNAEFSRISKTIKLNRDKFIENIKKPMPIFLGIPERVNNEYIFRWDLSYDFQGDNLLYDFKISLSPDMKNVIFEKKQLPGTSQSVPILSKGIYYWTVDVYDQNGNHQIPFDYYADHQGGYFYGVKRFDVE